MSRRSLLLQAVLAGIGVFLVDIWPVLLVWRAGASGSVGDLSEVRFLGVGLVFAVFLGVGAGWLMDRALRRAAVSPDVGRLDPWGAYALGIGVFNLALTAVPAVMYALFLADENQSLRSRDWLVVLLWVGGQTLAVALAVGAARALLGATSDPQADSTIDATAG